jgi:outer membrane protein OmpA-like peptidoglycan-associated protein
MISGSRFITWPAYVDLFAGLLVVMFGATVLLYDEYAPLMEKSGTKGQLQEAQRVANSVYEAIQSQQLAGVAYSRCSAEDICIDVSLEFERDGDIILPGGEEQLRSICSGLLLAFNGVDQADRQLVRDCLQIVVEGHTDSTQPRKTQDDRVRFKWNWDLSARRASSVLFAMKQNGIGPEAGFNVSSWGAADSKRLCAEATPECEQRNRRTTIRLKFDYEKYARIRSRGDRSL